MNFDLGVCCFCFGAFHMATTWVTDIQKEYESYDHSQYELKLEKKCIYKWPSDLARTSSMSIHRTPHMASLGPYHHGEEHLQPMEHQKKRALYRILKRCGVPLTRFVHSLQDIEQELRDSYDNLDPELPSDSFLRMMLIDGCFVLELMRSRSTANSNWFDPCEPIFSRMGKLTITVGYRDMLLLENQIPLLVLKKLLEVELGREIEDRSLNCLICTFYGFGSLQIDGPSSHILDIHRKCLIMAMPSKEQTTPSVGFIKSVCLQCRRLIPMYAIEKGIKYIIVGIPILFFRILSKQISKPGNMRSALRFHEAGIEFKSAKPNSGLKITFDEEHGVLTLPFIQIDDNTTAIYMNLMAFEPMHPKLT
ncbi:hypothetical protein EJ110_NYTH46884 [Nymphaea thermarum]|nr:hypothetical protein EJ110_NYTH46884 [Nymphaea thermarum]